MPYVRDLSCGCLCPAAAAAAGLDVERHTGRVACMRATVGRGLGRRTSSPSRGHSTAQLTSLCVKVQEGTVTASAVTTSAVSAVTTSADSAATLTASWSKCIVRTSEGKCTCNFFLL